MIYVVTNRHLIEKESMEDVIERSVMSGADRIILREKDILPGKLYELAYKIKMITDKHNTPLIVNGNLEVAMKLGAYGYHTSFERAKLLKAPLKIKLGVSIHTIQEAIDAEALGANYILAGNIFETSCKPGIKGKGIEFIENICHKINIPVIAIGGIGINNAGDVIKAGASGVAVMSLAMKDKEGIDIKTLKESICLF